MIAFTAMPLNIGDRFGSYEILAPLGAGGRGAVHRAHDARRDLEVALKILPPAVAKQPEALGRFEREAKAIAALSHPNILAIHDFGNDRGVTFAVTELLDGDTLRDRVLHGRLPVRKIIDYGAQVARGLAAAHERGFAHRDLKPENIFLVADGRVKILDFGLARQTGIAVGSATFAATAPVSTDQRDLTDLYLIEGLKEADVNAPQSPVAVVAGTPFFTASLIASANVSSSSSVV